MLTYADVCGRMLTYAVLGDDKLMSSVYLLRITEGRFRALTETEFVTGMLHQKKKRLFLQCICSALALFVLMHLMRLLDRVRDRHASSKAVSTVYMLRSSFICPNAP